MGLKKPLMLLVQGSEGHVLIRSRTLAQPITRREYRPWITAKHTQPARIAHGQIASPDPIGPGDPRRPAEADSVPLTQTEAIRLRPNIAAPVVQGAHTVGPTAPHDGAHKPRQKSMATGH